MLKTIDEIRAALSDRDLSVVSGRTGVSYSTLYRVRRGAQINYKTLIKLSRYLAGEATSG
jgi:predicted transcriptional regulator